MRIVYILDTLITVGGIERIVSDKMNWLADKGRGCDVTLLTLSQGNHPFVFPLSDSIRHIDLGIRFYSQYKYSYPMRLFVKWKMRRKFKRSMEKAIERISPDIIVLPVNIFDRDIVFNLKSRAKVVFECHSTKSVSETKSDSNKFFAWLFHLILHRRNRSIEKRADMVVALTQGDAYEWRKARHLSVIPNMYHVPSELLTDDEHLKRVIAVGRLDDGQKGFDLLINAWSIVKSAHPDWTLDIFGKGDMESQLRLQIAELGLDEVVKIHQPTQHIFEEYRKSAFFVLSSRCESFGLVIVESMLCGTPCVSFDCPYGPSEIIKDHEDGLLVENGNVKKLAEAICYMIEHDAEREEMGRKASENVKRYAPESIMPQWLDLFERLTGKSTSE